MSDFDTLDFETISFKAKKLPSHFNLKPWDVEYLISSNWKKCDRKVMIIVDHIPSEDIKAKRIFSESDAVLGLLENGWKKAQAHEKQKLKKFGFLFVSYNYFKTYHLKDEQESLAIDLCNSRMFSILEAMKPTDIHILGESIAENMFKLPIERRGSPLLVKHKKSQYHLVFNLSITDQSLVDDDDDDDSDEGEDKNGLNRSNLAGYITDNMAVGFLRKHPFDLSHIVPKYKLLDSVKKVKSFLKKARKSKKIGYDTETINLSIVNNAILTMQFTLDSSPDTSHIIILKHRDSPFSKEELKKVMFMLREFFSRKFDHWSWNTPMLIGQNLAFDLRLTRVELGIPVVHYRAGDTMAGEQLCNENLKYLTTKSSSVKDEKNRPFALDQIFARYNNTYYFDAPFGKQDRATIEDISIFTEGCLAYCAMDSIAALAIHTMQRKRARYMVDGKRYVKEFDSLVSGVFSDTIHVMSKMIQNGLPADRDYITQQHVPETSGIIQERENQIKKFMKTKAVAKANKRIMKGKALPQGGGLMAGTDLEEQTMMFDISTKAHMHILFFKVMKLKPVQFTETGQKSIGKNFLKFYGDKKDNPNNYHKEVELYRNIQEAQKVQGYLDKFFEIIYNPDGIITSCIHAGYGFVMVVTGRSNSFGPSLQQTPNHGQYAKIVKRCFAAKPGRINIKMDYSAHEIGCWSVLSGDGNLAATLRKIWNIKLRFRKKPSEKRRKIMKDADPHRMNFSLFSGKNVEDVTPEERQGSKNITFGVMFGKTVNSMARELGYTIGKMMEIYNNFFGKFDKEKLWLEKTVHNARTYLFTSNPFGFRRNLPGHMYGIRSISSALDRRAQNSPIQGFASQLGFVSARLLEIKMDETFVKNKMYGKPVFNDKLVRIQLEYEPDFSMNAMVHDSNEVDCSYELTPLVVQAMEYCATNGLLDYLKVMYPQVKFYQRPQVDFDIGDTGDEFIGWDYTKTHMKEIIEKSAESHRNRGNELSKKEEAKALKPTKRVKRMMKDFPLDLTYFKD